MSNIVDFDLHAKKSKPEKLKIPQYSEESLALDFVTEHRAEFRYVAELAQWFLWETVCWRADKKLRVFDWAREVCRKAADTALGSKTGEKYARALASAKTRADVVSLASNDQDIAIIADEFDRDLLLLGTPDGITDLEIDDEGEGK